MRKPWFRYYLHSFQFTLHNWKENFRVYYTHFEITGGPCNLIGTTPFFVLNHILFPANEEATLKTKQPIRFQGLLKITNQIAGKRKMKDEYHEANFATFVSKSLIFPPQKWMNLISNQLSTAMNWPSPVLWRFQNGCNNMNLVLGNFGLKSYLWFQIELMLHPCSILKSRMWFQPILHSTPFNYHYKSLLNQSRLHK